MKEREKMMQIHRIVINYYHFTTSTTFANEEDEKNYTQDLLDEIGKIVNLLPIHDVMQSDFFCHRDCSSESKCNKQCLPCADMEKHPV